MFTDRFIKVPIVLFDSNQNKLTNKEDYECDQIDSFKKILPPCIESYEPAMPAGDGFGIDNQTCTYITMKSGDSFLAFIDTKSFEKLLNEHQ